ncbi:hypothetical protein JB92DRAFT_3114584 [Gautieria morchelliformis]|nr:hypothetical protein JB92DRAFT_3114584 [Gautieria morchelliformis]
MPSTRLILGCILITLFTLIGIINYFYTAQASQTLSTRLQINPHKVKVIGGRWQLAQASLGIGPLPDKLILPQHIATPPPPPHIGFRRIKRTPPAPMHFAHDALRVSKISLKELVVSLRRVAHEDAKVEALRSDNRRGQAKLGRIPTGIRRRHISAPR